MKKIPLLLVIISSLINQSHGSTISSFVVKNEQENICLKKTGKLMPSAKEAKLHYVSDITSLESFARHDATMAVVKDPERGGIFKYFKSGYIENGGTVFAASNGGFWVRQFSGPLSLDWFKPAADGVTDDSRVIQKALNAAYKTTLTFTKGKTYRFINCYLPADIVVDLNGATIKPYYKGAYHGMAVFYQIPNKVNPVTGLFDDTKSTYDGSPSAAIIIANNQIINGVYDGESFNIPFCIIGAQNDYTVIKYLKIANNEIINCGNPNGVINIAGAANITNVSGYIATLEILNNDIKWSGANDGLVVQNDYQTGANELSVKTIDNAPINERVMVGRFVQVAGVGLIGLDRGNTYKTSGAVYRITSFKQTSLTSGVISIASGDYSKKSGWIADEPNRGLRFATVEKSWILPVSVTRFPTICIYPSFTGIAGSSILTRANTPIQNAYATALYPGLKISFLRGCKGFYTITSINQTDGSITVKPALDSSVTSSQVFIPGNLSPSSAIGGDIRILNVGFNKFIGGSHGVRLGGTSMGKGYYNDKLKSNFNLHDNEFSYNSMNMEAQTGSVDPRTSMKSLFDGLTLIKGQTAITVPSPEMYHVLKKDLDGDGTPENVLVLSSTELKDVTPFNSMEAGDIFTIDGVHGDYEITNISSNWRSNPQITITRWDPTNNVSVSGGLFNGVAKSLATSGSINARIYSKVTGAFGAFGRLYINHNKFKYPIDSYNLSLSAYNFIVENNEFDICERSCFEISGYKFNFLNNIVNSTVFKEGGESIPAGVGFSSGRGCGGGFSLSAANIHIEGNKFSWSMPSDGQYSVNSAQFSFTKNLAGLHNEETFVLTKNIFNGVKGILTFPLNAKVINGSSFSVFAYDYFEVSGNTFNYNPSSAAIVFRTVSGYRTLICNNIFNFSQVKSSAAMFFDAPNPEMFPAGSYSVKIFGNSYSTKTITASFLNNEILRPAFESADAKFK